MTTNGINSIFPTISGLTALIPQALARSCDLLFAEGEEIDISIDGEFRCDGGGVSFSISASVDMALPNFLIIVVFGTVDILNFTPSDVVGCCAIIHFLVLRCPI